MLEMFADFHPEGIGIEVVFLLAVILLLTVMYLAWITTGFPSLNYQIFLVEMQTWANHRSVQVFHLGLGPFAGDLIHWVRASGARFRQSSNETTPQSISDINIVIQSPETIVEGQTIDSLPNGEMRVHQVQMPIQMSPLGRETEFSDSELAALATLAAITGRTNAYMEANTQTVNMEAEEVVEVTQENRPIENATQVGEGLSPSESSSTGESSSNEDLTETSDELEKSNDDDRTDDGSHLINEKTDFEKPNTALKLKFLDDSHIMASTVFDRTVGDFKKEFFASDLAEGKVVRLIYKGQLLRDDSRSLASYGVEDQSVVHCHVSNTPYRKSPPPAAQRRSSFDSPTDPPSVPVSTEPPPPTGAVQHVFNTLITQFPLTTFRAETMSAAFHGFMANPVQSSPPSNGFLSNVYRRFQNALSVFENSEREEGVEFAARRAERPSRIRIEIGDFVLWIFAVQLAAVWAFWWMYPHLCANTAFYLLIFFTAYFLFVVFRHHIFADSEAPIQV